MTVLAAARLLELTGFADPFSSLSHLIGAGVFAVLSVPLILKGVRARHEDGWRPGKGQPPVRSWTVRDERLPRSGVGRTGR